MEDAETYAAHARIRAEPPNTCSGQSARQCQGTLHIKLPVEAGVRLIAHLCYRISLAACTASLIKRPFLCSWIYGFLCPAVHPSASLAPRLRFSSQTRACSPLRACPTRRDSTVHSDSTGFNAILGNPFPPHPAFRFVLVLASRGPLYIYRGVVDPHPYTCASSCSTSSPAAFRASLVT